MLNIDKRKRIVVSVFVAVAVVLPAIAIGAGNLMRSNETFAASEAEEAAMATSGFADDSLWRNVVISFKGKDFVTPDDYATALTDDQLASIQEFHCSDYVVEDWTGLDKLTGVKKAYFRNQANLTSFTPSNYFPELVEFNANDTNPNLVSVDLVGATHLEQFHANKGSLSSIENISDATSLIRLNANVAKMTSIDLSNLSALEELNLADNQLTSVTLPTTCKLKALNVRGNAGLSSFNGDLNACTDLLSLAIMDDSFSEIDVSGISGLKALKATRNPMTVVDISNNKELVNLQLDEADYAIVDVDPEFYSDGRMIYNYTNYAFIGSKDLDSSHGWGSYFNALIDPSTTENYMVLNDEILAVINYDNLPTVSGANATYDGTHKYVSVAQQAPAVEDTLETNKNYWDLVNNHYRLILKAPSGQIFKITYDANGGSGEPQPSGCQGTDSCTTSVSTTTPTWDGHTFLGWSQDPEATSPDANFDPGDPVTLVSDIVLYAVWQENAPNTYTLDFDSQGGSDVNPVSCTGNGSCVVTIPSTEPTYDGNTFKGWATTPDGTPEFFPGDKFTLDKNTTLYAIWGTGNGVITPNTGAVTDEGSAATSVYLAAGLLAALAFPVYRLSTKRAKKIDFTRH